MTYSLSWMADVLHRAGVKVAEQPGWKTRGHGDMAGIRGLIMHHTAGGRGGNMPSLGIVTNGRSDLAGPLCNLGLGRDGTFYVVAAGAAWHAGRGNWRGVTNGNSGMIGVECENTGVGEPWPEVQLDSFRHGVAALFTRLRLGSEMMCGHKEYCLPVGRKIDPAGVDCAAMRRDIAAIMGGHAPAPIIIPHTDENDNPTIRRGDKGKSVERVQKALELDVDGEFGAHTEAAVREFQRAQGLVADGIVGPRTWAVLEKE